MPESADVVVIGAGVAGASDAFFLSKADADVVVIDRADQPGTLTTARSAACFRAQASRADFAELVGESIEFYADFAEQVGLPGWDIGMRRPGWLFLLSGADGRDRAKSFVDANRALGVRGTEAWDGDAARERFPWVSDLVTAATFNPDDGWLSPNEVVTGFLKASGARRMMSQEAVSIVVEGAQVRGVETAAGFIGARKVVIACGPFSGRVAALAGAQLEVLPVRRQLAFVTDCDDVPVNAPMVADAETHAYWRPEGSGALLSVTRPEPPGDPSLAPRADWEYGVEALHENSRLVPFWEKVGDHLRTPQMQVIAGQYTCTADSRPLIGSVGGVDGLFAHTGDNGWGVESAPAAGRRLALAVLEGTEDPRFTPRRTMVRSELKLASNWP